MGSRASIATPWALLIPISGMITLYLMLGKSMLLWKIMAALLLLFELDVNVYKTLQKAKRTRLVL